MKTFFHISIATLCALALVACASSAPDTSKDDGWGHVAADHYSGEVKSKVREDGEVVANAEGSEVLCRKVRATGSHFPTRVCKTVEEWHLEGERSRQGMEKFQRGTMNPAPGG